MAVLIAGLITIGILIWQYIAFKKIQKWYVAIALPVLLIGIIVAVALHKHEAIDYTVIGAVLLISFGPYLNWQVIGQL